MELKEIIKGRHAVRKFKDKQVEQDKLQRILEAGNAAPTAKNLQPHRIYVLQSEEALEKLDTLTHCRYGAKTVLLFTFNKDEDWKNPLEEGVHSGIEDVSIVATHIMLAAYEEGLGSCWCNYFANKKLEETFNIPSNEQSVLILPIGYEADDSVVAPTHNTKKNLDEIVRYL